MNLLLYLSKYCDIQKEAAKVKLKEAINLWILTGKHWFIYTGFMLVINKFVNNLCYTVKLLLPTVQYKQLD